jgi:hypothetical protein
MNKKGGHRQCATFLTTVIRNQYYAFTGKYIHRYAQDSPDLRQKEIIKVIKKVFMLATGVDKSEAISGFAPRHKIHM